MCLYAPAQGTLAAVRALFSSPAAAESFADGGQLAGQGTRWEIAAAAVDASGAVEGSAERLQAFDLDDQEWEAFTAGIASLADQQARASAFH